MSYGKLAKYCAIGGATASALLNAIIVAISPLGVAYFPIAVIVVIVVALLAYLSIRLAWSLNESEISRKGHYW